MKHTPMGKPMHSMTNKGTPTEKAGSSHVPGKKGMAETHGSRKHPQAAKTGLGDAGKSNPGRGSKGTKGKLSYD